MTDRELLEMAAKAAGAKRTDYSDRTPDHWVIEHLDGVWRKWCPLTDDGDAFRLAVSLKLVIDAEWEACVTVKRENVVFVGESTLIDPFSATRRAITRAAAEIGKSMD